jgi:glutamate synthase (NADPH/NADH) small chain
MGEVTGFKKYNRIDLKKEPVEKRKKHWKEFTSLPEEAEIRIQGARCMDCGVPFCQSACPVSNIIPDFNDLIYRDDWKAAFIKLMKTNNFPEFTGRVCPAPCEVSCVLAINKPAVSIKNIELAIIERAYKEGWMKARPPINRSGKTVAIIGSGPAGLASADQLNKAGHSVTVFEKNEHIGGLLTLGIPNFKMEKGIVKRRINIMIEEGIEFKANTTVGEDVDVDKLLSDFDAIVLTGGAEHPRDIPIEGRELSGVHFAMDYLTQQNKKNILGEYSYNEINAKGKHVIVLGGGDTGSDCIGTANRQGALTVTNYELMAQPPKERNADNPWPYWSFIERTSASHEEGCDRLYGIMTKKFSGNNGEVRKLHAVHLEFGAKDPQTGRRYMKEIEGSEFEVKADLVLLALGFIGPNKVGLLEKLKVDLDERGNVKTNENKMTNLNGVFAAGDMRRGQSLVVWAINEGREVAEHVNNFLR